MNTIEVTILPEDFKNAEKFDHAEKCPLAMALKRTYPDRRYRVLPYSITDYTADGWDNQIWYKIPYEWGEKPVMSVGYYNGENIDDIIKRAKESMDNIPTVHLILTLIKKEQ